MSGETKAAAEGDLAVAIKAINEDVTALAGRTAWPRLRTLRLRPPAEVRN